MSKNKITFKVLCPDNNHPERIYIIKLFLEDFLGMKCIINFKKDISDYKIEFGNKRIIFEDHFFYPHTEELSYIALSNIPESYSTLMSKNIPIIYGRDFIEMDTNEIRCGLDIFASSFFLLTRWEEFVLPKRADGLRCDENDLFVVKNNLAERPLVNEYLILLTDFFAHLGLELKPIREFTVFQTHDVDWVHLSTFGELLKNLKNMVIQRKLYRKSWIIFWRYMYYRLTFINPFNSFDDFMNFSDSHGLKNSFYFKTCIKGEKGATYAYNDSRTIKAIKNIESRGHMVGFHPSENTYTNETQFQIENNRLLEISPLAKGGRLHHLLYHSESFKTWDKFKLGYDSGYGFQFRNGFRCGTCFDFPIFDIYERQQLTLREIPYVIMDTAFVRKESTPAEMEKESRELIDIVKKFNGMLCTVWHTNMFKTIERKKYMKSYYNIIKYALNVN
jgi:hypothetical protein